MHYRKVTITFKNGHKKVLRQVAGGNYDYCKKVIFDTIGSAYQDPDPAGYLRFKNITIRLQETVCVDFSGFNIWS